MYFVDSHLQLEIPGIDADTQTRFAALFRRLTHVIDEYGRAVRRQNAHNIPVHSLFREQQSAEGEEHYLQNLLKETNPDVRRERMCQRLHLRAELVAAVLWLHEDYVQRCKAVQQLAAELQRLQELLPNQPAGDTRLVAFCVELAGMIRRYKRDFDASDEMLKIKGVEIHHLLKSVNILFDAAKSGASLLHYTSPAPKPATCPFAYLDFKLLLLRTTDSTPEHGELIAALQAALELKNVLEGHKHQYGDAVSWLKRRQFAERLEEAMLPKELQPEWLALRDYSFDQIKQQQVDAEAIYFAATCAFKDWYPLFQSARKRLSDALAASAALLHPLRDHWSQTRAFDTEAGIATYKAMINCIHARYELAHMDKLDESVREEEFQLRDDFDIDTMAYIDSAVELGLQPVKAIIPTPPTGAK